MHSVLGACFAVGCMMTGLLGMAYYSSPSSNSSSVASDDDDLETLVEPVEPSDLVSYQELIVSPSEEVDAGASAGGFRDEPGQADEEIQHDTPITPQSLSESQDMVDLDEIHPSIPTHVLCCGMKWERRTLGILSAMFTGIYGGSIMAPMKWAPDDTKGMGYLISFSIGAATVNLSLWALRYMYLCHRHQSLSRAYYALPSFHFRKMWLYGGTCGLLWSIGNFFSIISVDYLGEGVGYSVVQASMLVSG